jgi:hypothetical protein
LAEVAEHIVECGLPMEGMTFIMPLTRPHKSLLATHLTAHVNRTL